MRAPMVTILLIALPAMASAQGFGRGDRAQAWDFSIGGICQNGEKASGTGGLSLGWAASPGLAGHRSARMCEMARPLPAVIGIRGGAASAPAVTEPSRAPNSPAAAAGLRYNIPGSSFVRASYSVYKLDVGGDAADPELSAFKIDFGWRF